MSGITPGKWLSDDQGYVFKDDKLGTTIFVPGDGIPPEERTANARATEAVHELIDALKAAKKEIESWECDPMYDTRPLEQITAALQKAGVEL